MAMDIARTAADDARDALTALDDAEREIYRWRQHLERVQASGNLGAAMQARRCASIVTAVVGGAMDCTRDAVAHADLPTGTLSS